jgi:hypothetical protein
MTAPERRSACSFGDRIVGRRSQSSDRLLKFGRRSRREALFGFVAMRRQKTSILASMTVEPAIHLSKVLGDRREFPRAGAHNAMRWSISA